MRSLLKGTLPLSGYLAMLRSLLAIYEALEQGMRRHRLHPLIAPIFDPTLERVAALRSDLAALAGPAWERELPVSPAALRYHDELVRAGDMRPTILLAHAWVRYIGDLSGGQILSRVLPKAMPEVRNALAFYEFPTVSEPIARAQRWRDALDALPLSLDDEAMIVLEACEAFRRHIVLFAELGADHPPVEGSSSASSA